jgi:hypothetical protein
MKRGPNICLGASSWRLFSLYRFVRLAVVTNCLWYGLFAMGVSAQTVSDGRSEDQIRQTANRDANCKILYAGIVGALETSNNKRSGVVQIRNTLNGSGYPDVCAKSFSPYTWMSGRRWILEHFPSHPGPITGDELRRSPKVILVGHSAGGWAVLSVARDLSQKNIPVELTIQIDSVGITDRTLPNNVKAGAIFHARDILVFLTTKKIKTEPASQTKLLANVRVKGVGHESITRDPRIREMVLCEVDFLRASDSRVSNPAQATVAAPSEGRSSH